MLNITLPPAEALIGPCLADFDRGQERARLRRERFGGLSDTGVCTDLSKFHVHLSWLRNTTSGRLPTNDGRSREALPSSSIPNPIFLYESSQLSDKNRTRFQTFQRDLQRYLGLEQPFDSWAGVSKHLNVNPMHKNPLDICDKKYHKLREELLRNGVAASAWILQQFLSADDLTISSRYYFEELLERWTRDPCVTERSEE